MKRPSFQFYPADWLRDTALRTCSTGARGLWIDMICYMHEGSPYGHLKVGQKVIHPENLARMVGEPVEVVEGWLNELRQAGVYDLAEDGSICSRRMIRDEAVRNARAAGGKLGGNPLLLGGKDGDKVNHEVDGEVKQKSTPSSSSSSSSSKEGTNVPLSAGLPTCPQREIVALYAKHLPHLAQPRVWEGNRAAMLKQRWIQAAKPSAYSPNGYNTKEGGLKWWSAFFEYIKDTTLSKGFESEGRTWRPDLEWIVTAGNFAKIIDGKYDK